MSSNELLANGQGRLRAIWRDDTRTMSHSETSQTISFARITLIIGLVWLHYGTFPNSVRIPLDGMNIHEHQLATFLNSFNLFFFFSVVPLLSIISGWLFFSFSEGDQGAIKRRVRSRFMSLYLPLILWNTVYLALFLALLAYPRTHDILQSADMNFDQSNWYNFINAIFGFTSDPIGFQFWFIRDLFLTVLISPILWLSIRKTPLIGLAVLAVIWLSGYVVPGFLRMAVPTFFYIGGLLRFYKIRLEISKRATAVFVVSYVLIVGLRTMAPYYVADATYSQVGVLATATRSMRLVGVLACWGLFQHIAMTPVGAKIARYGGLAFFVFCAHFPLMAVVKIVLWHLVPAGTDGWMLVHFVASASVTSALCVFSGILLARLAPNVFALSNGGRLL